METILVATDFSDSANNAVNYAIELAKYFSANLVLVNSYPMPYSSFETGGMPADMLTIMQESSEGGLKNLKEKIEKEHKHHFNITCYSKMGFAEDVIINIAAEIQADLIVMGIVGDGEKTKRHLIGGTAIKVARNTNTPTFIIPSYVTYHPIKKISFACDIKKTEESDLLYVSRYFTKVFNAEMEIINVEQPGVEFNNDSSPVCSSIDKKLETVKHQTVFITNKNAGKALEDYLENHPTDLLIINPKKHDLFHNLFSHSITKELAFHSQCPLLCIQ